MVKLKVIGENLLDRHGTDCRACCVYHTSMRHHNPGTPGSVSFQSMEIKIFSGILFKGDYNPTWENAELCKSDSCSKTGAYNLNPRSPDLRKR